MEGECVAPSFIALHYQCPCLMTNTSSRLWFCPTTEIEIFSDDKNPLGNLDLMCRCSRSFFQLQASCLHALASNSHDASVPAIVARFVLWGKFCSGEFGQQLHSLVECLYIHIIPDEKRVRFFTHQGCGTHGVVVL